MAPCRSLPRRGLAAFEADFGGRPSAWRAAGILAAVRINPIDSEGRVDLAAAMRGAPDIVLMSKVAEPAQVAALDEEVSRLEERLGLPAGATELAPNIESARGIMQTYAIAKASPRVTSVVGSTEDLAADLNAPRSKAGAELAYARQRLHLECTAAEVLSVDCPTPSRTFAAARPMRAMRARARLRGEERGRSDPCRSDQPHHDALG